MGVQLKYVKCYSEIDNTQGLRTFSVYTKHNTSQIKRSYLGTRKVLKLGGTWRNFATFGIYNSGDLQDAAWSARASRLASEFHRRTIPLEHTFKYVCYASAPILYFGNSHADEIRFFVNVIYISCSCKAFLLGCPEARTLV